MKYITTNKRMCPMSNPPAPASTRSSCSTSPSPLRPFSPFLFLPFFLLPISSPEAGCLVKLVVAMPWHLEGKC